MNSHRAPRWGLGRTRALTIVGAAAVLVTTASILPILAGENGGLILRSVADTTITQVPQDGDNSMKTTLASCPSLCDDNPHGRRDATLQFAIDRLPADAVRVKATLRVYAWHDAAARIVARTIPGDLGAARTPAQLAAAGAVQALEQVRAGYNDFDVSGLVRQNGSYTFALSQETLNTRVYWASRENAKDSLRPELVLSYEMATPPPASPSPAPSATTAPPGHKPSPSPSKPTATTTSSKAPKPTTSPTTNKPPADPDDWTLVWSDEFTGGAIDRAKWNVRDNEGRDIDKGCNVSGAKNSFVGGGNLTLRALREPATCSLQTREYTQAYLDTIGKGSWRYGRFEIRAKSPNKAETSAGLWPAFWLRPDDAGNGEIDVTELPGGASWYDKSTAAIFWDYTPVKQDTRIALPGGGYPGDGFHIYTTQWDSNALRWYIDGRLVWMRDRTTTSWYDKAFNKPYNIRLNFQVGGWLGDPDAKTAFPADFVVDYVRVYQH